MSRTTKITLCFTHDIIKKFKIFFIVIKWTKTERTPKNTLTNDENNFLVPVYPRENVFSKF